VLVNCIVTLLYIQYTLRPKISSPRALNMLNSVCCSWISTKYHTLHCLKCVYLPSYSTAVMDVKKKDWSERSSDSDVRFLTCYHYHNVCNLLQVFSVTSL